MDQSNTDDRSQSDASFSIALHRELLDVYGESAFHYFLNIERERSIRSGRLAVLLRVDQRDRRGAPTRLSRSTSERLFLALAQSVRETDFIGWYENGRVAGAVLTEVAEGQQSDSLRHTLDRIRRRFETHFPVAVSSRLEIRVNTIGDERTSS
jgi:hypothetical protein